MHQAASFEGNITDDNFMSNTDILVGVIRYKRARVTASHGYSSRDVSLKLTTTRNKILTNVLLDTTTNNIGQLEIVVFSSISIGSVFKYQYLHITSSANQKIHSSKFHRKISSMRLVQQRENLHPDIIQV